MFRKNTLTLPLRPRSPFSSAEKWAGPLKVRLCATLNYVAFASLCRESFRRLSFHHFPSFFEPPPTHHSSLNRPMAQQVKLQSVDEQEFTVSIDVAKMSETVKHMVEGALRCRISPLTP